MLVTDEDRNVTATAMAFYEQLLDGSIDRSQLDPELSDVLNERLLGVLSSQLRAVGTPRWAFVERVPSERGALSVYRLILTGGTLRLTFGVDAKNVIWNFLLGPE